ncbi:MAG: putative hydroxymethylpyrimidine transporter CytX [Armatimonadota bacterium]|nr:putative hydroxymethylpyrimidine transporter CytX [Armatimonadota bacterium]MDR7450526.1 putative hydroxymethylpyrimidine transporter CytX [Armatimonadota bacterium]MDR7466341.1 putative hydroxymethylpyrimidine transporter CytX [Armatimonadota bacterium]MDR7493062.1 putative hydroxymethylpyrimidine transporter CytX [Armatimonadota bacterium]MDR7498181.1 putative hydroxymethylpyrimidine transporter CytX [Armatimonadota bacterium]
MAVQTRARPWIQAPPEWGIEPVPAVHRQLGLLDYFALWSSLGVGLLVLLAGTLLVPGLGFRDALAAIVVGTLAGNLLLALAGVIGSATAVPTMVLLRPALGVRGSYLPTVLNVVQLIGWGSFEVFIMARAADGISRALFGLENFVGWAFVFAAFCTLLAIGGPLVVVRRWLERFAIWLVYLSTGYLTWYLITHADLAAILARPGDGSLSFWLAVDLVIAMPVSWLPLVADYNRFARRPGAAFAGTYAGYLVANVWFYALGALFVLALHTTDLVPAIMSLTGGWAALVLLLVDETDNAFANIYSTAVSLQNIFPRARQRWLAVLVGALCFLLAIRVNVLQYESFLFLIGAFFVPLFGVLAADFFVVRRQRYDIPALYREHGPYWYRTGINGWALAAWLAGFVVYQWIVPTEIPGWKALLQSLFSAVGLPFPLSARYPWLGASIPGFLLAAALYLVATPAVRRRDLVQAAAAGPDAPDSR